MPSDREVVRDAMPALFDLIQQEDEASVRAVPGPWMFGYVHPFPDGNGRLARFLMNVLLAGMKRVPHVVDGLLQVQPGLGLRVGEPSKPKRGVGCDRPPSVDDLVGND